MSSVRPAVPDDVGVILEMIHELAVYEREPDAVETTEEDLHRTLFGGEQPPTASCHVAEVGGEVVGMALWFLTFSTWRGRNGIWLEDLYVRPAQRGTGLGKALLAELAVICVQRGYPRLEWTVLNWNEPSLVFYRSLGAVGQDDWTTHRLDGPALGALGAPPA